MVVSRNDPSVRKKQEVRQYKGKNVRPALFFPKEGNSLIIAQYENSSPVFDDTKNIVLYNHIKQKI